MNKIYKCKKINHDINIDGIISKKEWNEADSINLCDTVLGTLPRLETSVKALWSDNYIYFAFSCEDDYIKATMTDYNDRLYEEDVVEVFIDDNMDMKTYIEIEVNPLNTVLHYMINNDLNENVLGFSRNEKKVISAVKFDDRTRKYDVEIAIPFSEFVTAEHNPPICGDKWGINFYRIDRGENGYDEYSAWSPTGRVNYHVPERFGEIVFDVV